MGRPYPEGSLPYIYHQFFTGPFRHLCEHSRFPYSTSPDTYEEARILVEEYGQHCRLDQNDWIYSSMLGALRSRSNSAFADLRNAREAIGQRVNRDLRLSRYEREVYNDP